MPMRLIALTLACIALAVPVSAQPPQYYAVHGVAPDDVLNIRAEPDANAEKLGSYAPDARPVEVLETRDGWGRVLAEGRDGWVALDFLEPIDMPQLGDTILPDGLRCAGTEPFWDVTLLSSPAARFRAMTADQPDEFAIARATPVPARPWTSWLRFHKDGRPYGEAVVRAAACSDGMSDQTYGYAIDLSLGRDGEETLLTGCCNIEVAE